MTEFTVKEIGSGWDVRNLNIDQPIVKFIHPNYPDQPVVIDSGWELYNDDQELTSCYSGCCYYIDLQENQPTGAATDCGGWTDDTEKE